MSSAVAAAQAEDPGAFLRRIYAPFFRHNADTSSSNLAATLIYDADLVALMDQDSKIADRRNEPPAIDSEPLCDCQEMCGPLTEFSIRTRPAGRTISVAHVRFRNCGALDVLIYKLVATGSEWRVADIRTPGIPSLAAYLVRSISMRKQEARGATP